MNEPNKQGCYITLGLKALPRTNALAYWVLLLVTNKIECCEYGPIWLAALLNLKFGKKIALRVLCYKAAWVNNLLFGQNKLVCSGQARLPIQV